MAILTKEALLGASDLVTREVSLQPHIDGSVRVKSLPATYSNEAASASMEMVTDPKTGRQRATANTGKMEELQVLHGLVEPKLDNLEEVRLFASRVGASWAKIVDAIQEISGLDRESVERTETLFQPGGSEGSGVSGTVGAANGSGGSDIRPPVGA